LVVLDQLGYDIVEDLNKTRENILLFELSKLKQQKNNFSRALGTYTSKKTNFYYS
jgi:hypothetical protein